MSESLPPLVPPEQLIRTFDRDGDGQISRDEAPPRMRDAGIRSTQTTTDPLRSKS